MHCRQRMVSRSGRSLPTAASILRPPCSGACVCSGRAAAEEVRRRLKQDNLQAPASSAGVLECYTTDNPERFGRLTERFGGRKADSVRFVGTDELEGPPADAAESPPLVGAADGQAPTGR